jgi:transglutaminase-like putative cysteine protease
MTEPAPQRLAGFLFSAWLLLHAACFPGLWSMLAVAVLCGGIILRWAQLRCLHGLEWLFLGFTGLMPFVEVSPFLPTLGMAALWMAAVLLLQPVTPRRGLWLLLAALIMLASLALDPGFDFPNLAIILDVAFVLLLAQQIHAPASSGRGIRDILLRSGLLAIPIAAIVTGMFWIFPALSQRTDQALSGFSGSLNPGDVAEMRLSRRPAFVATFASSSPVPSAANLYWRGAVLVRNDGLNWSQGGRTTGGEAPVGEALTWRYSLASQNGAPVLPLDFPVAEVPSELWLPEVVSSAHPASDPPDPVFSAGNLDVPAAVRSDPRLQSLAEEVISPVRGMAENLDALATFLRTGGFVYSLRPGTMASADVAGFLFDRRKGYCEHYAAACANLLRLAGHPARVITGYRGGRWNPWRRTISVQDADAHAWVEVWDPAARRWVRFDPTEFVAPELTREIENSRRDEAWPWYQRASVFVGSLLPSLLARFDGVLSGGVLPGLAGLVFVVMALWLWLSRPRRDPVGVVLERLEKYARRCRAERKPGETPLAWVRRLAALAPHDGERLCQIALLYEECVYAGTGREALLHDDLLRLSARLSLAGQKLPAA